MYERQRRRRAWLAAAVLLAGAAAIVVAIALLAGTGTGVLTGAGQGRGRSDRQPMPATSPREAPPMTTTEAAPTAPPAAGPPAQPPPATESFGVNVNGLFNSGRYAPRPIGGQLAALRATGATVARSDALWEASEPAGPKGNVHTYDWSFDDLIAASLAAHGLAWFPILDYTAQWSQSIPGQDHSPPRSSSDYAAFAAAFAARYGRRGSFWSSHPRLNPDPVDTFEIWNEPDNQEFWRPLPDAAGYAELYLRARDAITAVDPTARVIVGGLTHPEAFLPKMLRARPDLLGHIDGVAIHPYGANPFVVLGRVRGARGALASLGLSSVPLYVTEFGWTTSPPGVFSWASAQARPGYISSTIALLAHTNCGIAGVQLYTWVTGQLDPSNKEDWYGIQPPSGGSSRDTKALAAGLRKAAQAGNPVALCAPAG